MTSSTSGAELSSSIDSQVLSQNQSSEWKREANHRLAAHRARRSNRATLQAALPGMEERSDSIEAAEPKTRSVAARVAERYAKAPTYSEILATEARNAARAAEAAAAAADEARHAAQAILVGLDAGAEEGARSEFREETQNRRDDRHDPRTAGQQAYPSKPNPIKEPLGPQRRAHSLITEAADDESEAFVDEDPIAAIQPLPANLIEFPRELVAARKARPRLAEGPLREEYDRDSAESQLRIFEVEAETISTEPKVEPVMSSWSSIRLDPEPTLAERASVAHREKRPNTHGSKADAIPGLDLPLQTASLEDRIMAGLVDAGLIAAGFLLFVFVFVACTTHPPVGKPAYVGAAIAFSAFAVIYELLFFSFGSDTPGMRYAKIALCTFDDENPCRRTMRRRLGAFLLSVSPLGLGILWAFFDDDRLGWHDRISRTYQRSYR